MKKAPTSSNPKESAFNKLMHAKTRLGLMTRLESTRNHGRPTLVHRDSYEYKNINSLQFKITFSSDEYSYDHRFAPGIAFYKFLAKRSNSNVQRLCVSIPDTIVFNESMIPVWIYTGLDGFIYRTETFHDQLILNRLGVSDNPYEVVSVVKRPMWSNLAKRYHGLNTYVLNTTDLKSRLNEFLSGEPCAVQRFIKSKGPVAFVCRVVYKKNKKSLIYVITNKTSFRNDKEEPRKRCLTSSGDMEGSNIIISSNGKYLEETLPLVKRIVNYLESNLSIEVTEFAGDFIKDDNDHWWFITCKAFQFKGVAEVKGFVVDKPYWSSDSSRDEDDKVAQTEYNRLKRCRLCQVYYPMSLLPHQLTIKMITETDQHLRERGVMIQWLDRAEYRHSGHATIYQNYRVCKDCYNLYELTEELKEIQKVFSEVFSIPSKEKNEDYAKMPEDWKFESDVAVVINSDKPKTVIDEARESKPMKLFRMLIIMLDFNEPKRYLNGHYELHFSNFEISQVYKLSFSEGKQVKIEKFKLYQFFVNSRTEFKSFLKENNQIEVTLKKGSEIIGKTSLELSEFMSPIVKYKSFYKVLSSHSSVLGYLNCKIAIEEEEYIDVTNIPLKNFSGIFVPPEDFILCLPLPEEWLTLLPDLDFTPSEIASKTSFAEIPVRVRSHSAKPKHVKRSLNTTQHSLRPRSCTSREKLWKISIEIHTVSNITNSEEPWKLFFEVFKARFMADEITRSEVMVYFKTKKDVYVKGGEIELERLFNNEKIEARIASGVEIGRCFFELKDLKRKKEIKEAVGVDIVNREGVFLEFIVGIRETQLISYKVGNEIGLGCYLLSDVKGVKHQL